MATSEKTRPATHSRAPGASASGDLAARHRTMALLRAVGDASTTLSLEGRAGLVVPTKGTEALVAGLTAALEEPDWALPSVRHAGIALARGASLVSWFAQVLGRSADPSRGRQEPGHVSFRSLRVVSVGTAPGARLPHAVGVARSIKRAARGECAVATCGEAATATPDFGVALNFAGLWRVPVVFVVASDADAPAAGPRVDVAARADAFGVAAARADGRDVADVERVMREALARARRGEGATLVDVSCSYPPQTSPRSGLHLVEDSGGAWPGDPLARPVAELFRSGLLTDEREQQLLAEIRADVAAAVADASRLPPPPGALLFQDVFARRTPALSRQRAQWLDAERSPGTGR